ncbi:MAG: iron response transcriptional regulator IrrA [Pseudomonadota bacterium]
MTTGATDIADRLRTAGLRPTRQRIALGELLFAGGDRHVTAELLHEEAVGAHLRVSLATVYNTLHQFKEAGLLRAVAAEGNKTFFDTNTSDHYHFVCEPTGRIMDVPAGNIRIDGLPAAPDGMEVVGVDVIVRVKPATS